MITPGQRLSFLQQDHFKYDSYPVLDTVIMGNSRLYEIMKEKEAIYAKEDFTDEDGIRASELEGEFAEMNGWEAESDAATLLNGLGIETEFHYSQMSDLTGSQKVKVLLAQALFGNPDILLLDEPTNHLDLPAIEWLEEFLINFDNTIIVVFPMTVISLIRSALTLPTLTTARSSFMQETMISGLNPASFLLNR